MNSKLQLKSEEIQERWQSFGEYFIHTKLLQMTKNPSMDNGRQHVMYVVCIYVFIVLIEYQGWSI